MYRKRVTERCSSRISKKRMSQQEIKKAVNKDINSSHAIKNIADIPATITSKSTPTDRFNKILRKNNSKNTQSSQNNLSKSKAKDVADRKRRTSPDFGTEAKKVKLAAPNVIEKIIPVNASRGSAKRKSFEPRKLNEASMAAEEKVPFFDHSKWQKRSFCCGAIYESDAMPDATIINISEVHLCAIHCQEIGKTPIALEGAATKVLAQQISKQTTINSNNPDLLSGVSALRKPQLFTQKVSNTLMFKEVDLAGDKQRSSAEGSPSVSNEMQSQQIKTAIISRPMVEMMSKPLSSTNLTDVENKKPKSAMIMKIIPSHSTVVAGSATIKKIMQGTAPVYGSATVSVTPSISTPLLVKDPLNRKKSGDNSVVIEQQVPSNINATRQQPHASGVMNTMYANPCKVIKNNSAIRLKQIGLSNAAVDNKSYRLLTSKTPQIPASLSAVNVLSAASVNGVPTSTPIEKSTIQIVSKTVKAGLTSTAISSASSGPGNKYSDNSSDSGFDENIPERKSVSPLQEDTECREQGQGQAQPNVQTLFLANGVQIQGQIQNVELVAKEAAAKIIQPRKQQSTFNPTVMHRSNSTITTAVKIAHIPIQSMNKNAKTDQKMGSCAITQAKMRAIYNNNSIQHENGITTIVPASSLAASSQVAAMSCAQPNTVTITPSPPVGTTYHNMCSIIKPATIQARKLSASNVIQIPSSSNGMTPVTVKLQQQPTQKLHYLSNNGGVGDRLSNATTVTGNNLVTHQKVIAPVGGTNNTASLNPRIILLKTAPNYTSANDMLLTTTTQPSILSAPGSTLTITTNSGLKSDKNISWAIRPGSVVGVSKPQPSPNIRISKNPSDTSLNH